MYVMFLRSYNVILKTASSLITVTSCGRLCVFYMTYPPCLIPHTELKDWHEVEAVIHLSSFD